MTTGVEFMNTEQFFFESGSIEVERYVEELYRYTLEHGTLPEGASDWLMPVLAKLKECMNIDAQKKPSEEG